MPVLPTGLVRDKKSGVYYHRRRIPQDLVASYDKSEHIVSLKTSSYQEALQKFQVRDAQLILDWERRRQRLADFFAARHTEAAFVISELTPELIEQVSKHFESAALNGDEFGREEGHYDIELVGEYKQGYGEALSVLKAAVAIGDVETLGPLLQQFLDLYRYQVNLPPSDYRRLAIAFGRAAIRTNEQLLRRLDGENVQAPIVKLDQH